MGERMVMKNPNGTEVHPDCRWAFTLNNPTAKDRAELGLSLEPLCQYGIIGDEIAPTTGTPHFQGFCVFHKQMTFKKCAKLIPLARWVNCDGSSIQNKAYCSKEKVVWEWGECPVNDGMKTKERFAMIRQAAKEGRLEDIPDREYVTMYRSLKQIAIDNAKEPDDLDKILGYWLWSAESGTGKSAGVRRKALLPPGMSSCVIEVPVDPHAQVWWDNYKDHTCVVFEEWTPDHKKRVSWLKEITDHYAFPAQRKGSMSVIRPKMVVICSNFKLGACFSEYDYPALARRFKEVNVTKETPFDVWEDAFPGCRKKAKIDEDE